MIEQHTLISHLKVTKMQYYTSVDVRLKKLSEEKHRMATELQELQEQVAELRTQRRSGSMNGPFGEDWEDMQRETQKQITEARFKLQKAEQEITTLQSNLARAETQVIRYKSTAEASEKSESELKIEKRKLQREVSGRRCLGWYYYLGFISIMMIIQFLQMVLVEVWDECHLQ